MKAGHMSLRRENTAPPRFYGTSPAKRQPRASFTSPQQRAHQVIRRGSLGVIQSNSAEKKLLFSKRSNSLGGANDDYSPTKLDFQSLKKRPSLLGTGKLKSGNKETEAVSNRAEKHSMVILGAGGVGKTALVVRFVTGRFLNEYDPTLEMVYEKDVPIGESIVSLEILDTAGNAEASYIRNGEGFIVVYSINDHYSFEVARQMVKLIKEVRKSDGECQVPVILVGNKRDLRRGRQVSKEEARETASEFCCSHYETSALTNRNVQMVFFNMVFQVRFTKKTRLKSQGSSGTNGFLSTVRQLFSPQRRSSLPSS